MLLSKMSTSYVLRAVPVELCEQWDEFVSSHPAGHVLQSWNWGELKASSGWHPVRLALWNEETQRIVAAAQVLRRTAPYLPVWAGHLAYIPRGPVIDWSQTALCEFFFSQLDQYLYRYGALALRIEPGQSISTLQGEMACRSLAALGLHSVPAIQPLRTIMLDLAPNEEALLAHMKEKWRYNIRLAARKGVSVRVAETVEDVQAWYKLLQTTSERDQFGIHTCDYYIKAWRLFAASGQLRLFLAEYQEQILAGIFVSLYADEAIYLYGASSNEQRQLMPNYLLQWEAIRWARQQGAQRYDFWGIPQTEAEDEAMAGVYRFKRGWGGQVMQFPGGYERIYRPLLMRIAKRFLLN